eukprot:sb/3477943/
MLSYGLMTNCYHNYEKKEWVNILEVKMQDWGNLSLFEVAQITNAKNFLSHAAYQSYLTDIWMGEVHPSTPFFLVRKYTLRVKHDYGVTCGHGVKFRIRFIGDMK